METTLRGALAYAFKIFLSEVLSLLLDIQYWHKESDIVKLLALTNGP